MTSAEVDAIDAIVIGGGHNGLVAAGYLARAGLRVRLLERLAEVGGAAVSVQAFDGVGVRLSRYSYLVSLLPARIVDDLGVSVRLAGRRFSSYTPDPATEGRSGLLIGRPGQFAAIGAAEDEPRFAAFYQRCRLVTQRLWPTLLEPLRHAIADAVGNDLVRGVIATDALIGTFARLDDPSLRQNVCFLYHVLGGGTGDWDVPVGGMGSLAAALATAASGHGAEIITGSDVFGVEPDGRVRYRRDDEEHVVRGRFVLAGVTPTVLAGLLGDQDGALAYALGLRNLGVQLAERAQGNATDQERRRLTRMQVRDLRRQIRDIA